ncbi:hypothetical protein BJY16_008415 [Actinoplanes octamycinicus]|uniref:Uncharacterized protein n=1 Tax=Actinoplanes octamycinicus TaxID=135948 RepID=A0A7W7H6J6_9ACTN|nr:hypothetical protein [Actinoplanes octamycinicus]MBB4744956.1 hypothetical protein [Actinoplanes octamycinicus]
MLAATRELLDTLDPLPYHVRMRRLAAWARTAADRAEVCADLRAGDGYQRHLALVAALVARDAAAIDAARQDPLPGLRSVAIQAALRAGRLGPRVAELSAADRRRVYRTLRARPHPSTADALIHDIRACFGDAEAAALLPGCSAATVRELLPDLAHATRLAAVVRRHPAVLAEYAAATLAAAPPEDLSREWARLAGAILTLPPGTALDLLDRYAPDNALPGDLQRYGPLAGHDPRRLLRLLTAPGRAGWLRRTRLPPVVLRRLATLPDDELAPLARGVTGLAPLLRALPPARRGTIYDAGLAEQDTSRFVPDWAVLDLLPAAIRVREVRRLLALDEVARQEQRVLDLSGYLDWPEAAAAQQTAVRSGDAGERAQAYARLVAAAGRSRDTAVVAEVVTRLTRLRNEQDPVRSVALTALAGVARLLTAGCAAALTTITTDAVEARDASAATSSALSRLATETLQRHVDVPELREWALLTIDLVSTASKVPTLRRFDQVLRRGQETMVVDRLRPWVRANLDRARYAPLFALTEALGKRAWRVPELQDMLREAAGPGTKAWVAREAIDRWLEDPRERDRRVAEVLAADPSAVLLDPVWRIVATRRTDLVDEVLAGRPVGRFADARTRAVPGWVPDPRRWLPRQLAALVALHAPIIADPQAQLWERTGSLRAVAPLGETGRELVLRYVAAPEVHLAETALAALVWTERPDLALPVLLPHAGDDRARVAMYAAARAAKHLPPAALTGPFAALLDTPAAPAVPGGDPTGGPATTAVPSSDATAGPATTAVPSSDATAGPATTAVPSSDATAVSGGGAAVVSGGGSAAVKVTSRKEAVRILARYGPPASMDRLLAAYTAPDQHRDVRAAIVGAARQRLDAEASWAVLERAIHASREERRAVLDTYPHSIPARHRPRYAALIAAACRADDRQIRQAAFTKLPDWARWAGDLTALVVDRLTDLAEPVTNIQVAALLRATGGAALDPVLHRLAARTEPQPEPGADLPARRRVEVLAQGVATLGRSLPPAADRSALIAGMHALAARPGYLTVALSALVSLGHLDNLLEIADRCAGRPVIAARIAERVGARLREDRDPPSPAVLHDLIERLAWRGDLAAGLFAVQLVRFGAGYRWAGRWRELLMALRSHPDPDVRDDAVTVTMT